MHVRKYLKDYYNHQKQSFIGYSKGNLRKVFIIEYCTDQEKLERIDRIDEKRLDYDEVFQMISLEEKDAKPFDTFDGIAMETYIRFLIDPCICCVKMWEEIYYNGEFVQERYIEPPATFCHDISTVVASEITKSRDVLRRQTEYMQNEIKELQEENKMMRKYIYKN